MDKIIAKREAKRKAAMEAQTQKDSPETIPAWKQLIVDEEEKLKIKKPSTILNQSTLKNFSLHAIEKQIKKELKTIKAMEDEQRRQESLKKLFSTHWQLTANTAFSYQSAPDLACNQLMLTLANEFFQPKTQQKLLALLMPTVTHRVTLDYTLSSDLPKREAHKLVNLNVSLSEGSIVDKKPYSYESLSQWVIAGKYIFDIHDLKGLPLALHKKISTELYKKFPEIADNLYSHSSVSELNKALSEYGNSVFPARVHLKNFQEKLLRSSKMGLGTEREATPIAITGYNDFFSYLNTLNEKSRQAILQLTDGKQTLETLLEGGSKDTDMCTELKAECLYKVLLLKENQVILDTVHLPEDNKNTRTQDEIIEISFSKNTNNSILPAGTILNENLTFHPSSENTTSFILAVLLSLKPEQYKDFFTKKLIHFFLPGLGIHCKRLLNDKQIDAFFKVLSSQGLPFRGIHAAFLFSLELNDENLIAEISGKINSKEIILALKEIFEREEYSVIENNLRESKNLKAFMGKRSVEDTRTFIKEIADMIEGKDRTIGVGINTVLGAIRLAPKNVLAKLTAEERYPIIQSINEGEFIEKNKDKELSSEEKISFAEI